MKQLILFIFALCLFQSALAQKNAIKTGFTMSTYTYVWDYPPGAEIQYSRLVSPFVVYSAALGYSQINTEINYQLSNGGFFSSSFVDVTIREETKFGNLDLMIQANLNVKRFYFKPGFGLAAVWSQIRGPLNIDATQPEIQYGTPQKKQLFSPMFISGLELEFLLGQRVTLSFSGNLRSNLSIFPNERTVMVQRPAGPFPITKSFTGYSSASVRMGYRF